MGKGGSGERKRALELQVVRGNDVKGLKMRRRSKERVTHLLDRFVL